MKKIAVPVTKDNQIDDHFGHCEYYGIYNITEDNEVVYFETIKSEQGCGCKSNIAGVLAGKGVSVLLAGGIGGGAINVLGDWGIRVIRGCSGDATDIVQQYIEGTITDSGESCLQHKHHHGHDGHGHVCSN